MHICSEWNRCNHKNFGQHYIISHLRNIQTLFSDCCIWCVLDGREFEDDVAKEENNTVSKDNDLYVWCQMSYFMSLANLRCHANFILLVSFR